MCVAPTNLICHETSFSNFFQMDTHLFFVQELFFSSSLQIGTHVFFSQDPVKPQVYIQLMNK